MLRCGRGVVSGGVTDRGGAASLRVQRSPGRCEGQSWLPQKVRMEEHLARGPATPLKARWGRHAQSFLLCTQGAGIGSADRSTDEWFTVALTNLALGLFWLTRFKHVSHAFQHHREAVSEEGLLVLPKSLPGRDHEPRSTCPTFLLLRWESQGSGHHPNFPLTRIFN